MHDPNIKTGGGGGAKTFGVMSIIPFNGFTWFETRIKEGYAKANWKVKCSLMKER